MEAVFVFIFILPCLRDGSPGPDQCRAHFPRHFHWVICSWQSSTTLKVHYLNLKKNAWQLQDFQSTTVERKHEHDQICLQYNSTEFYFQWGNLFNTLGPKQNDRHFPDVFKWIFVNENAWLSIKISLKFVPWGLINNTPALIMARHQLDDKPLSEQMMVQVIDTYMHPSAQLHQPRLWFITGGYLVKR